MNDDVLLSTRRLYLRRFTEADADALFALDADPEVMRYISRGRTTPRTDIVDRVLPAMTSYYDRPQPCGYWAAHEAGGSFVGWMHLRPDRLSLDDMELGYRLRREVWGRGYATELALSLIALAFERLPITRIVARTLTANRASRRVMEKCGMRYLDAFVYPAAITGPWPETERRAVRYVIDRPAVDRP